MKKPANSVSYAKSESKPGTKSKETDFAEVRLATRKTNAVKTILLGSAALSVAALSLFAFKSSRKKQRKLRSMFD